MCPQFFDYFYLNFKRLFNTNKVGLNVNYKHLQFHFSCLPPVYRIQNYECPIFRTVV